MSEWISEHLHILEDETEQNGIEIGRPQVFLHEGSHACICHDCKTVVGSKMNHFSVQEVLSVYQVLNTQSQQVYKHSEFIKKNQFNCDCYVIFKKTYNNNRFCT